MFAFIINGEEKKCQLLNKNGQLDAFVENIGRETYGNGFSMNKRLIENLLLNDIIDLHPFKLDRDFTSKKSHNVSSFFD